MKSINPTEDLLNLHRNDAAILDARNDFKNDLGQRITFYEDPTLGEDSCIWVAFPDYEVAFLSSFYDLDDMTAKLGSVFTPAHCIKNGWSTDDDMDYVPRVMECFEAFYETDGYAQLAGVYDTEEEYINALPDLERFALKNGFNRVTEAMGLCMKLKFEIK